MSPHDFLRTVWEALSSTPRPFQNTPFGDHTVRWYVPDESWFEYFTCCLPPAVSCEEPDFEIHLITRADLSALPSFPLTLRMETLRGRIPQWCDSDFLAVSSEFSLHLVDRTARRAVLFYNSPANIPIWDRCAPFRIELGFLGPALGYHLVHGGAVSYQGKGTLLVGRGGSGKSSTAIACLSPESELRFLGEDYTLISESNTLYPLYTSLKVGPEVLKRMPWLGTYPSLGTQEGKVCRCLPPESLPDPVACEVLLWPDRSSDVPLVPISKFQALKNLAPSTLFQNPNAGKDDFRALAQLCRSARCYALGLGDSPPPGIVEERLKSAFS